MKLAGTQLVLLAAAVGLVPVPPRANAWPGSAEEPNVLTVVPLSAEELIEQIKRVTDARPEQPIEGTDHDYELWRAQMVEIGKKRIALIEQLEQTNLSEAQLDPYFVMKLDDIRTCFHFTRLEANKFEAKLYHMADSERPRARTLAEELFWSLNIWHANTHTMSLSDRDLQKMADFEVARRNDPEAGRLLVDAVRLGNVDSEQKAHWLTWILEKFPETSEGYQAVEARNRRRTGMGEPFLFKGKDVHGNIIDLDDLKGNVVLLDFWAFWCGICIEEIPQLRRMHEAHYDKGLRIIGVFNDYRMDQLKDYMAEKEIPWPQLVNDAATKSSFMHPLAKKYGISGLPCYLLIGRDGRLRKSHGRVRLLEPTILELLGEQAPPAPTSPGSLQLDG